MSLAPDTAGFITAQNSLRDQLGSGVTFFIPVAPTWPVGTKINADTGEPYDATAKRTNDGFTTVVKTVIPILKQASPLRPQPDTQFSPAGELSGMDLILDVAQDDYPDVRDATELLYSERRYRIVEAKPFEIAGTIYRQLIYAEEK